MNVVLLLLLVWFYEWILIINICFNFFLKFIFEMIFLVDIFGDNYIFLSCVFGIIFV